ncbi:MAG: GNAT family N-acetyltransferase [Myxococcota bacterium]
MSSNRMDSQTLRRAIRKLREVGFAYSAALALRRIVPAWLLSVSDLVVLRLPTDRATAAESAAGRWARAGDVAALMAFGHARSELDRRLARGDRAWALVESGQLLGYCWFTQHDYHDAGSGVVFPRAANEVWLYDAMVDRDLRGRGLYPRILSGAAHQLGDEGVRSIWIIVDSLNRNSIRAHEAAGASVRYRVRVWTVLGRRWENRAPSTGSEAP